MWIRDERTERRALVLLSILAVAVLSARLLAEERSRPVSIALVAVGKFDGTLVERLKEDLARTLNRQVFTAQGMPESHCALKR